MALDKQRILSELGNVMNQLQSADCGCAGKLFSNPRGGCSGGGCGRGCCCGHGFGANYNSPGGGEPYAMNAYNMQGGGMPVGGMSGGGGMPMGGMPGGAMSGGGMPGNGMPEGGMQDGGMSGGGMYGGGMPGGGAQGGGMEEAGMYGGGMQGGGMPDGGMQGGGMHGGGMHGGGMHGGGMHGGGMHGGGMRGGGMFGGGMHGGGMHGMASMGRNAPKLYADTYNYLSQNLMQPTIKEVYNDLASITPQNTIGQNPLAAQMGLSTQGNAGNPMMQPNSGPNENAMQNGSGGSAAMGGQMPMGSMGNPHQNMSGAAQMGATPSIEPGNMGMNPNQGQPNMGISPGNMQNPVTQYVTQDNMYTVNANPQMTGKMTQNMNPGAGVQQPNYMNANPSQQIANSNPYGQQPQSAVMKNMFGASQGDLNFDPMSIAIQMNPANKQKVAMETMNKIMNNNQGLASGMMQPTLAGAGAQNNIVPQNQQLTPEQQNVEPTGQVIDQSQQPGSVIQPNQQFAYTALTGAPVMNQQIPQQQMQGQQYQQVQQQIDPNTGAVITPGYEGSMVDPNAQMQQQYPQGTGQVPGQDMREPVYAADTRNATAAYMTPKYSSGPFGNYQAQGGYNVKNTMSKTSLAGTRPIGSTASRSQLQHIYRQYKASHSATQQNIRPPPPVQGGSLSEGHLHSGAMHANPPTQIPVEKVGGDTYANNPGVGQPMGKAEPIVQQANVPTNLPQGGDTMMNQSPGALLQKRGRNGMQDLAYTPYRATTAWSFHG